MKVMQSNYQKLKRAKWENRAWAIAFILMSTATMWLSHSIKYERKLTNKIVKLYNDSLIYEKSIKIKENESNIRDWHDFTQALIFIESSGRDSITSDNGKAVGCLQLHPSKVKDANDFIGAELYSLNDRYDRRKSIEIFEIIAERYNPERNIERMIHIWNPKAGVQYRDKIMKKYNEIKDKRSS